MGIEFYMVTNLLQQFATGDGLNDIEGDINAFSIRVVGVATIVLIVLLLVASRVNTKKKLDHIKKALFAAISATILLPTLLLIGSTIYVNTISESGGPVHWHTDIEFWVCGQEIELRDPYEFLSNKIGTATYHEHDDKRIHLEGVVIEKDYDASLEKFMVVTGGVISETNLIIPTNDDIFENDTDGDVPTGDQRLVERYIARDGDDRAVLSLQNGDTCGNGSDADTEVQAFVLRFDGTNDTYYQEKLEDPAEYIMRDESVVPPGDCVIVEFDRAKNRTDRLCQQFGVRDAERCTEFGVKSFDSRLCKIREVQMTSGGSR